MRASSIDNRRIPLFEGIERRDFDALLAQCQAVFPATEAGQDGSVLEF